MPAYNEEAAIESFLTDIGDAFSGASFRIVVVDDCSTDNTQRVIESLAKKGLPISTSTNQKNFGHGPSTLMALNLAIELEPQYVVATDGDGHIAGDTLRQLYHEATTSTPASVIEGVRTQRDDPWFRKFVSAATRFLVKCHSGQSPKDANTPFRVYPAETLGKLLAQIPPDHMTPNLVVSTFIRRGDLAFREVPITPHKRQGNHENGSTWKQKFRLIPSCRFLQFLVKATAQSLKPGKGGATVTEEKPHQRLWRLVSGRGSVGRYGMIGVTGVAIDFIIFALLVRAGMIPVLATTISTLAGISNNYNWNSMLNFRLKLSGKRGATFLTVGLMGLAISAGLLQLLINLGVDPFAAKWISIPVVVAGQFLANKFWTFRETVP